MTIARRTFVKQTMIGAGTIGFVSLFGESLFASPATMALPFSSPEAEGISSASILQFVNFAEKHNLGLHSLMVIRNGKIVTQGWWDPYKPGLKHVMFSLSKSFTSTAVGFAVGERLVKLDDKVVDIFPEDVPADPSANLKAMTVRHLLTMTTGNDTDTAPPMAFGNKPWVKSFLTQPVPKQPGTYFLYNTGATYILSAIVTKVTGKTLIEYLTPRLFKPLDIVGADWEVSPQGINTGGWGLRITTKDVASLGLLYLQNGMWNGKQVLPVGWADEATKYQVSNVSLTAKNDKSESQQGYGYQFWRSKNNFFRADGALGQFSLVSRDLNTVIAMTSETASQQVMLDAVWDNLLPGIKAGKLPPDVASQTALKQKMASLTLLPQKTDLGKSTQAQVSGKVYNIQTNSIKINQASLTFANNACTFIMNDGQAEHKVICGLDAWVKGETLIPGAPLNFLFGSNLNSTRAKVAAVGIWTDDKTFVMTLQYFETPHSDNITCHFENDTIRIEFLNSMVHKSDRIKELRPVLEGKA